MPNNYKVQVHWYSCTALLCCLSSDTLACSIPSQASTNTKYCQVVLFSLISVLQAHQNPGPKNNVVEHWCWSEQPGHHQGQSDPCWVPFSMCWRSWDVSRMQLQAVPESNQALDGLLIVVLGPRTSVEEHWYWSKWPGHSQGQINPWQVLIPAQSPPSCQDPGQALRNTNIGQSDQVVTNSLVSD